MYIYITRFFMSRISVFSSIFSQALLPWAASDGFLLKMMIIALCCVDGAASDAHLEEEQGRRYATDYKTAANKVLGLGGWLRLLGVVVVGR